MPCKQATAKIGAKKAARKAAAKKPANRAASKKDATASVPREFSKKQVVLEMLRRKEGATLDQIMQATGWLRHTCRGFLSIASKTIKITSSKTDAGRIYRIASK